MSRRSGLMHEGGLSLSFLLLLLFFLPSSSFAKPPSKPNIVFILADDLGYGDLGCYGQKRIRTPNLDRLSSEGMRFTDCYAGSTVCAPSRCCLMTGMHTGHARIRGNKDLPLLPEDVTVAQVLKSAGYATAIIGKWGLGEPSTTGIPNRKGFDEWFGYLNQTHAHNYYPDYLWRNEEKVPLEKNRNGQKGDYADDLFTEEALKYLDRKGTNSAGNPFFLYLAYTIPHANNELGRDTGNGIEVPSDEPYSNEDWPQQERNFAASITRMDRDVGTILGKLKQLGIEKNTVVFFSSDNGPHKEGGHNPKFFGSSGGLRGIKRDLYEGGIRVPMIVRWPETIHTGATSDHPWAFWDFLPTAAELAGVQPPTGIDGVSMLGVFKGGEPKAHEYLYWEFHEGGFAQAIRFGNWKAIRKGLENPLELYDLADDKREKNNIAIDHADVIQQLEPMFQTARTDSRDWPLRK